MTLLELRDSLDKDCRIIVDSPHWSEDESRIEWLDSLHLFYGSILYGTDFANMTIKPHSMTIKENLIHIETDMPNVVFCAWKDYVLIEKDGLNTGRYTIKPQ